MSELIVKVVEVDNVEAHPNADRLDIATIKGWQCVVSRGDFVAGDKGLYIPIDSILPIDVEEKIFGPESKVKLSKSRVKTIKLRGAISQGLLTRLSTLDLDPSLEIGTDLKEELKIKKYEPSKRQQSGLMGGYKVPRKTNTNFKKYTSIENVKNYVNLFKDTDVVSVTEKIHGTNFRAGYVKRNLDSIWKKALNFIGILSDYEFVYGSHNVQLQKSVAVKSVSTNVYLEAVKRDRLSELLKPGEVIYGEIYGSSIQKNYMYDCKEGQRKSVYFDLMKDGKYLTPDEFAVWCKYTDIQRTPELYRGPFDFDKIKSILKGNSVMTPTQKIIEGGVCKSLYRVPSIIGRKVLKFINDDYLLKDNSELH